MGPNGRLLGGTTKIARMARFRKLLRNIRSAFGQKKGDMVVFLGCRLTGIFKLFHFEHI